MANKGGVIDKLYEEWCRQLSWEQYSEYAKKYPKEPRPLRMSSTGSCIKKTLLNATSFIFSPGNKVTTLGNLIHKDIQAAYLASSFVEGTQRYTEFNIKSAITTLTEEGHIDIMEVFPKKKLITLYDIKTIGAYKWQKLFGLKKNQEPGSDDNYRMQLGMYALAVAQTEEYSDYRIIAKLLYYKKDSSEIREITIDVNEWATKGYNYYRHIQNVIDNGGGDPAKVAQELDNNTLMVPVSSWECNIKYCVYAELGKCNSKFIK